MKVNQGGGAKASTGRTKTWGGTKTWWGKGLGSKSSTRGGVTEWGESWRVGGATARRVEASKCSLDDSRKE